jgi:hypothetical protein
MTIVVVYYSRIPLIPCIYSRKEPNNMKQNLLDLGLSLWLLAREALRGNKWGLSPSQRKPVV